MEAQHGVLVSTPHSLLVLDDEEAVAELRQLELPGCHAAHASELLHRLGAVLRFGRGRWRRGAAGGSSADGALLRRVDGAAQVGAAPERAAIPASHVLVVSCCSLASALPVLLPAVATAHVCARDRAKCAHMAGAC